MRSTKNPLDLLSETSEYGTGLPFAARAGRTAVPRALGWELCVRTLPRVICTVLCVRALSRVICVVLGPPTQRGRPEELDPDEIYEKSSEPFVRNLRIRCWTSFLQPGRVEPPPRGLWGGNFASGPFLVLFATFCGSYSTGPP